MNPLDKLLPILVRFFLFSLTVQKYEAEEVIPEFFDARTQWPLCKSIGQIRNSLNCSADWAFAAVSTMSDRLCIQTEGKIQFEFSPQDLISCCTNCSGCSHGEPSTYYPALNYWKDYGLVSGGDYGESFEGCKPYTRSTAISKEIPPCERKCQSAYAKSYEEDKIFGKVIKYVLINVDEIQKEIMTNGPVLAGFSLWDEFFDYKDGVYEHTIFSTPVGYTYVKILGWGTENGKDYWLVANSWGTEWGIKGTAKFLRGQNLMGIETNVLGLRAVVDSGCSTLLISWILIFSTLCLNFVNIYS